MRAFDEESEWRHQNSNLREGLDAFEHVKKHNTGFKSKTPINAQRFYMRQDLVNKKIIKTRSHLQK